MSSVGPRSDEEARVLWSEGEEAAIHDDCPHALVPLRRFIDRYPGDAHARSAQYLLGRCELSEDQAADAIHALRFFVDSSGARRAPEYLQAKALLARALIQIGDFTEALLVATELERDTAKGPSTAGAEAWLLKSEALAGKGETDRATRALDSARALLNFPGRAELQIFQSEAAWLALRLNTQQCARFPSRERMDESQARSQIDRRGNCEMSGLLLFREVAALRNPVWTERAANVLTESFTDYARACRTPPDPLPLRKPKVRDAAQLRRYHDELQALLADSCLARYRDAQDLLSRWRKDETLAPSEGPLERVEKDIHNQSQALANLRTRS